MIKHKDEWPQLVEIGRLTRLVPEEIILLLVLREIEDGGFNNEFNILSVKDTNYMLQAMAMARHIVFVDYQYQKYLKSHADEKVMPYLEYFKQTVIKSDIGEKGHDWCDKIKNITVEITNEFEFKKETL